MNVDDAGEDGWGFGIDIGGSGIKAAPVDLTTGRLMGERYRLRTPQPASPMAVVDTVHRVVAHFGWSAPVGAAFPAVVKSGVAQTAANVDRSWIGLDVAALLGAALGVATTVVNDADAAGLAEIDYGAGRGRNGVVILLTLGTGIGSAVFLDGRLMPNTEFGHLEIDGVDAETRASDAVRERENLSWSKWAKRLSRYLSRLEALLWPDLIILGGGGSKKSELFLPLLDGVRSPVVPARLLNNAGIVGAALSAVPSGRRP